MDLKFEYFAISLYKTPSPFLRILILSKNGHHHQALDLDLKAFSFYFSILDNKIGS